MRIIFILWLILYSINNSIAGEVYLYPETIKATCGDVLPVQVLIKDAHDLMGIRLNMTFDSDKLEIVSCVKETIFAKDNAKVLFFDMYDNTKGYIEICTTRCITSSDIPVGIYGNGTVATVYFCAMQSGITTIKLAEVDLRDSYNQPCNTIKLSGKTTVEISDIQIRPNPYYADKYPNVSYITIDNLPHEVTDIKIYTLSGEFIKDIEVSLENNSYIGKWDITDVASGMYFCVITNKYQKHIIKKVGIIK
jgi:hypothetical protein